MEISLKGCINYLNDKTWYCYNKYNPAPYWKVQDAIAIINELVDNNIFTKEQLRKKFDIVFQQIDIINSIEFEDYKMRDKCGMDYIGANDQTLVKMCGGCENYFGKDHDYKECQDCISYKLFMQVKLLDWHKYLSSFN